MNSSFQPTRLTSPLSETVPRTKQGLGGVIGLGGVNVHVPWKRRVIFRLTSIETRPFVPVTLLAYSPDQRPTTLGKIGSESTASARPGRAASKVARRSPAADARAADR